LQLYADTQNSIRVAFANFADYGAIGEPSIYYEKLNKIYQWQVWVESIVSQSKGISHNIAWHLPFGELLDIIKFSSDSSAAAYLQQKAEFAKIQNK
jgi:hypothetical protein